MPEPLRRWAMRLPVPVPVAGAAAAIVVFALVAVVTVRLSSSSGGASEALDASAPPATDLAMAAAAAPAPSTTLPIAPGLTRAPAEEDAARRAAFIETMKKMGLTPAQADCAANKVQETLGLAQLSQNLLDPGKPGELEKLIVACMKG